MRDLTQRAGTERAVRIQVAGVALDGDLVLPPGATGIVLFAHGSGSSRMSSRNRHVARALQEAGLGTLLMDLLTREEETADARMAHLRFDIPLLAQRLIAAVDWLQQQADTSHAVIACFGASTGAGAALVAAAERPASIAAVVSRGGRPDLAGEALARVMVPVLLIVGGHDEPVIEMNRAAMRKMKCEVELQIVPRATHLFEEPGALEEVGRLAADWFARHLRS